MKIQSNFKNLRLIRLISEKFIENLSFVSKIEALKTDLVFRKINYNCFLVLVQAVKNPDLN